MKPGVIQKLKKTVIHGQKGFSLIEMLVVIIVLGIILPPLTQMLQLNMFNAIRTSAINKASYYAQQRMEKIVADYANETIGYDQIAESMSPEYPAEGYTTTVIITPGVVNTINYKEIEVKCTNPQTDTIISLKTWIIDWT